MLNYAKVELLESRRLLTVSAFPISIGDIGVDTASSIAADRLSNVIVAGKTDFLLHTDTAQPAAAAANVAVPEGAFVAKFAPDGTVIWTRRLSTGFGETTITKVATDGENSIYIAGSFSGTVDFDPRRTVHNVTAVGGTDAFVCKLSKNGNLLMVKTFGGASDDAVGGLAVDSAGNIFLGGTFKGRGNFDPNGTFNIGNAGGTDGFIESLDSAGTLRWVGSFGGGGDDTINDLAVDDSGNVVATGHYISQVDFDPSRSDSLNVAITQQAYILKWDSNGAFVFANGIGGTGAAFGSAVTVDRDGIVYGTGNFSGTSDFDPGAGTSNLTAPSSGEVYVTKLTPSGALIWAKAMGGTLAQDSGPGEIAVDKAKNVYTSGTFAGTKDFDPSGATSNLASAGFGDVFISKLNGSGNFVFARSQGGTLEDTAVGLVLDRGGNILTTGNFNGTANFGAGGVTINLTSAGSSDIYVSKLDSDGVLA